MSNEITTPIPPPKEMWRWGRFEPTGAFRRAWTRMMKNTTEEVSRESLFANLVGKDEEEE